MRLTPGRVSLKLFYLFLILCHIFVYTAFNPVNWIQQMAYRHIMIQCINDQCNVFAHITGNVIWFCKKLLRLIYHIGSEKLVKYTSSMCFIEFLKVVCKPEEIMSSFRIISLPATFGPRNS